MLGMLSLAQGGSLNYAEGFNTDTSVIIPWGSDVEVTHETLGGNGYAKLNFVNDNRGGAYTYGPGKTPLPSGFGVLRQSIDIYVDPDSATVGTPIVWTMEVGLQNAAGTTNYGEFDFFGKWVQDDGEGDSDFEDLDNDNDTTDWVYKLGRNNDFRGAPVVVEQAGWFTFTSEWIDDGTSLTNHNYITQDGTLLFEGDSAQSPWTSSPAGYKTGYMWIFGRNGSTETLGLDNLSYQATGAVPEPLTMLAVGSAVAGLGGYIRRRRRG